MSDTERRLGVLRESLKIYSELMNSLQKEIEKAREEIVRLEDVLKGDTYGA